MSGNDNQLNCSPVLLPERVDALTNRSLRRDSVLFTPTDDFPIKIHSSLERQRTPLLFAQFQDKPFCGLVRDKEITESRFIVDRMLE